MAQEQKIHPATAVKPPMPPPKPTPTPAPPPPPPPLRPAETKRHNCLCKIISWTVITLLLLLLLLGATVGALFLVFRPKAPKYSVDRLKISELRLNYDASLYAKFDLKVTANNPNEKIGIYYEKGSELSVWYTNTKLCVGPLPRFYQGPRNVTRLAVSLAGASRYGSTLMKALQEQQRTGRVPLDLKISARVGVKMGSVKLRKVRVLGHCLLAVDSIATDDFVTIKASECTFGLKL